MKYYIENAIEKINEYCNHYDEYNDLEKIEHASTIQTYFNTALDRRYIDFRNEEIVKYFHDVIMKLECLNALITLDNILLKHLYNSNYRELIREDVNKNIIVLIKEKLKLFITIGPEYQLQIKDKYEIKQHDLGNTILNNHCESTIRGVIELVVFLEIWLKDNNINTNIMSEIYKGLTTQQLAFIYAQLTPWENTNDSLRVEERQKIFEAMWIRSDEQKILFMETIYRLGYCHTTEGFCAMIISLYKTHEHSEVYNILRNLYLKNRDPFSDDHDPYNIGIILEESKGIKTLRDKDIRDGNKEKPILYYIRHNNYNDKYKR